MKQKTILFDIGNVLIGVDFPPFYEKVFGTLSLDSEKMDRFIKLRDLGDTGKISKEDFSRKVCDLSDKSVTEEEMVGAWNGIFSPISEMWEVVEILIEAGHRLILFSNTNDLHLDYLRPRYPILREFPEGHFSCVEGCLKPDSEFFNRAIARFDLIPEETLYLDDSAENVEAGRVMGFRCHQYDQKVHSLATNWLEEELGDGLSLS